MHIQCYFLTDEEISLTIVVCFDVRSFRAEVCQAGFGISTAGLGNNCLALVATQPLSEREQRARDAVFNTLGQRAVVRFVEELLHVKEE